MLCPLLYFQQSIISMSAVANMQSVSAKPAGPLQELMSAVYYQTVVGRWSGRLPVAATIRRQLGRVVLVEQQRTQVQALTAAIPGWGRELGESLDASAHGIFGVALVAAPSLRVGMDAIVRFGSRRTPIVAYCGRPVGADGLAVDIRPRVDFSHGEAHELVECTISSIVGMIRRAYGEAIAGHVQLRSGAPLRAGAVSLASHLRCGEAHVPGVNFIYLTGEILDRQPVTSDARLFNYALERLRACETVESTDPFLALVRHLVETEPNGPPSVHRLSRGMAMSARTLERRLNERNSGYRTIVEEWRRSKAQELLLGTTVPLDEIGQRLGYSEPSNFSRAVRRWFGCSPGRLRAAKHLDSWEDEIQSHWTRDEPNAR